MFHAVPAERDFKYPCRTAPEPSFTGRVCASVFSLLHTTKPVGGKEHPTMNEAMNLKTSKDAGGLGERKGRGKNEIIL